MKKEVTANSSMIKSQDKENELEGSWKAGSSKEGWTD